MASKRTDGVASAKPANRLEPADGPDRRSAARNAEQGGDGDAGLEGGFAEEAEVDDEDQQRGDFESGFGQCGAEEVGIDR